MFAIAYQFYKVEYCQKFKIVWLSKLAFKNDKARLFQYKYISFKTFQLDKTELRTAECQIFSWSRLANAWRRPTGPAFCLIEKKVSNKKKERKKERDWESKNVLANGARCRLKRDKLAETILFEPTSWFEQKEEERKRFFSNYKKIAGLGYKESMAVP